MASALDYWGLIQSNANAYGISPQLVAGVIQQESSGNTYALSTAGAKGLMQLMPDTAKELGVYNVYSASDNIAGGVKYLTQLLKRYKNNVETALLAYNWGMGNVDAYLKTGKGAKGQAMPTEAKEYAAKVKGKMNNLFTNANNQTEVTPKPKWYMDLPATKLFGAGVLAGNTVVNNENGVLAGVGEAAGNVAGNLSSLDLVGGVGNFALRAVVILSAVALIAIGFYFMFKQEIVSAVKAVV